ncbi:dTDP-4-amino-4,6-dideoxygalactose transaminase [Hydrogenispora ethanolica]|uniref:dTDP-4-amino-4,6-dideoxygalactose transaminase n=1 Tax=Hydrogenispora ethanolica TaxID=1082276 RepID=UPI00311F4396
MAALIIPFYKPYYTGAEESYIRDAMARNRISGDGFYTAKVKEFIEEMFSVYKVFLTTSATHALEMAALLLNLEPGDEVLMPSFTFPSTANAVVLRGARPVFVEIQASTLNIDPADLEEKITPRSKAIIPVHYAGIGCEMDQIMSLAREHQLQVIEDAAQAVNASYRGRYLGTWGQMGCYSFHETKNITCGEGGALLINVGDTEMIQRAEQIIQKGTNRRQFIDGEVDRYTWVNWGSSYTPSEVLTAFLYAQFMELERITAKRRMIHGAYTHYLLPYARSGKIGIPVIPSACQSNYHLYYILFPTETARKNAQKALASSGIETAFHYVPLHSSPMGQRLGYRSGDLPLTEDLSRRLLRLPFFTGMTDSEIEYVMEHVTGILEKI